MKRYSPYIKKYIREITEAGYTVNDSGSHISKCVGCYEILITDLTVKSLFTKIKKVLVWIKNKETRVIEIEKLYKHELLPLPFHKIDSFVQSTIADFGVENTDTPVEKEQKVVRDLDLKIPIPKVNVRDVPVRDIRV